MTDNNQIDDKSRKQSELSRQAPSPRSVSLLKLKDQFVDIYVKLRFDYKISHDDLEKILRKEVIEKSKNKPNRRIIYNTSYGGFGYSELFYRNYEVTELDVEYEDDREHGAHLMCPFGKLILDIRPEIKRAVYMEYTSDIAKINYDTYRIVYEEYKLEQFRNNVAKFRDYYTTHDEKEQWRYGMQELKMHNVLPQNHMSAYLSIPSMYTFDSIKNVLDNSIAEEVKTLDKIAEYKSKIDKIIPQIKYIDDIPEFFEAFKKIMKLFFDPEECSLIESRRKIHFASEFEMDAKSIKTWKSYRGCGASIMYFMLHNKSHVEYDKQILNTIYETFGLRCASGQYASLAITEIPALCSYEIEEYDGSEKIIPL